MFSNSEVLTEHPSSSNTPPNLSRDMMSPGARAADRFHAQCLPEHRQIRHALHPVHPDIFEWVASRVAEVKSCIM